MANKHTDGKWFKEGTLIIESLPIGDGPVIAHCGSQVNSLNRVKQEANAKRIVACVNALDGISNEALEAGVVGDAILALKGVYRDKGNTYDGFMEAVGFIIAKLKTPPITDDKQPKTIQSEDILT